MKKNIVKVVVGAVMCVIMGSSFSMESYSDYDPKKAVEYAKKYAISPNDSYHEFDSDCTNFASQCLKAGGIKEEGEPGSVIFGFRTVYDSNTSWFHKSILSGTFYKTTKGWTTVEGIYTRANTGYLASKKLYVNLTADELAQDVKAGDIVLCWYGEKAGPRHTIICVEKTGDSKKKVFFASHSSNYSHDSLKDIYSRIVNKYGKNGVKFALIRPKAR